MKRIRVNLVEAILDGQTWSCPIEGVRAVLQTLTDAVDTPGHVPDIEEHILSELANKLEFTVVDRGTPDTTDTEDVVF